MPSRTRLHAIVSVSDVEREQLEAWVRAHGTPQQVALRCRIVLAAVDLVLGKLAGAQRIDDVAIVEDAVREASLARRPVVVLLRREALFGEAKVTS